MATRLLITSILATRLILGGGDDQAAPPLPNVQLQRVFPRLTFVQPVLVLAPPDGTDRLFVLEQPGRIKVFPNRQDVALPKVFLDLRPTVYARHSEEGLLAMAFHPQFTQNQQFFLYYSASNPRRGVLSRFRVTESDLNTADPGSEEILLEVRQPWGNHNGCDLIFGPDGYLYASFGDGGGAGDPQGNGQDLGTLLATIIRIDVDRRGADRPYGIPPDNPFVDHDGARPEIWAWGLRNVWRMSFDPETGDLWAGDVGQNAWEEIDLIVRGGNYGWNIREGAHDFRVPAGGTPEDLIDPAAEYSRREGGSVTGGVVCHDPRLPGLRGAYLYADYMSGGLWAIRREAGRVVAQRAILAGAPKSISSFGEGADGTVFLCGFRSPYNRTGALYRLMEMSTPPVTDSGEPP